ncbi:hypothetical protein N9C66_11200 [Akkermansiaceae bacterium]|nr:hypothetical protein [Akkermansiaceae bacterium]MDA9831893.1 hypothetical protein [Akkermansiaceae bacterium]MDB4465129.1 hypothetical protein [Akkermansiaceae bacterium]MDB4488851.1 hypothetical protein [Akkermansiaceae bacterium]
MNFHLLKILLVFSLFASSTLTAQEFVKIGTAFRLTFDSEPGVVYSIESSEDMEAWTREDLLFADSDQSEWFVEKGGKKAFYRVEVADASDNWLQGSWEGVLVRSRDGLESISAQIDFDFVEREFLTSFWFLLGFRTPCTGPLQLRFQTREIAVFDHFNADACLGGTITFRRIDEQFINCNWTPNDTGVSTLSGLLTKKIPGE